MNKKTFDVHTYALDKRHLFIEASAGTGKTYALQELVIRFILEKEVPLDKILLITFTKNATHQLRRRIRARLEMESFKTDNEPKIMKALMELKKIDILTIDSFFQKILREHFFLLEISPNFQIDESSKSIRKSILDTLRKKNYRLEEENFLDEMNSIPAVFGSYDSFVQEMTYFFNRHLEENIVVLPYDDDLNHFVEGRRSFDANAKAYEAYSQCLQALNQEAKLRSTSLVFQARQFLLHHMDSLKAVKSVKDLFPLFDTIEIKNNKKKYSYFQWILEIIKTKSPYQEPFLSFLRYFYSSRIMNENEEKIILNKKIHHQLNASILLKKLIPLLKTKILEDQKNSNLLSYGDVLEILHKALQEDPKRAKDFSKPYEAIFIDEFQDTNEKQWAIIKELFYDPSKNLTIVGDPKQCLYGFRKASPKNYENVKKLNDFHIETLSNNYRSSKVMVQALNCISPIIFERSELDYDEVASKNEDELLPIFIHEAPVSFYSNENEETVLSLFADQVVHYLNHGIKASEIFILVRKNSDLEKIKDLFEKRSIPTFIEQEERLFESEVSLHVLQLIEAIAHPTNKNAVKIALMSLFFSLSPNEVSLFFEEEEIISLIFEAFKKAKESLDLLKLTESIECLETLSKTLDDKLQRRHQSYQEILLKKDPSLKNWSNLEEILELLIHQQYKTHANAEDLSSWLKKKREDISESEIARNTLEENAIKLMTIHKSKGLENKIIFVFYKMPSAGNKQAFTIYRRDDLSYFDLSRSYEDFEEEQKKRELQEEIRILYVAISRASQKLHLYIHQKDMPLFDTEKMNSLLSSHNELFKMIKENHEKTQEILRINEKNEESISCLKIKSNTIQNRYTSILSYSSLHSKESEFKLEDFSEEHSKNENEPSLNDEEKNILSGKSFGLLIHELLESIDFCKTANTSEDELLRDALFMENIRKIALTYLQREDYIKHETMIIKLLQNILNTPILSPSGGIITLKDIRTEEKKQEVEFYFHLGKSSHLKLSLFDGFPIEKTESAYLKGFIDLVFKWGEAYYLIDWKSNHLGQDPTAYTLDAMEKEYKKQHYDIQMHLYILALSLALKKKEDFDYEKHIGGAFYCFVKGMEPSRVSSGVLYKKPSLKEIEQLSKDLGLSKEKD